MRLLLIVGLLTAGCATMRNTPEQEYVYAMARPCEISGARLEYVSADGKQYRGSWAGGAYTWPEFQQCLRARMVETPFAQWKRAHNLP